MTPKSIDRHFNPDRNNRQDPAIHPRFSRPHVADNHPRAVDVLDPQPGDLVVPPAPVFRFWHTAKRLSSIDPTDSTGFSSIDSTDSSDSSIRKQGGCWCLWVAVINPWALCLMEYHGV